MGHAPASAPPRASVRNPHAPAPARRTQPEATAPARRSTQSGRSSASAREPEPLADDLPARTRICPRSYREPRRRPLSARPRLSEGGPSTRSHACPQSRREPARPAQGSRAPASAVRKRLTHPRTPPSPGQRPTARTPRPPSAASHVYPQPHREPHATVCCPHLRARGCASCFRARLCYSLMAFSLSRARAYTFRAVFRSSSLMPSSGPCMPPTQSGCFCQVRSGPKLAPLVNSRA